MILPTSLKKDEILASTKEFIKADPSIVELVIYAFYLLEQLKIQDLDFVFKGGTCLMLHFDPPQRFSTDIDITTKEERKDIEGVLDKIITDSEFIRWELDARRSYQPGIPKAHYKLSFQSDFSQKEREILLDILFEESMYPILESKDIQKPFLNSNEELIKIDIPTCDALLGDKLTAFAPGTIGIQFNRNKGRDIIKQVFDIGKLFSKLSDIDIVSETFSAIADKEIDYRKLDINEKDVAEDIFEATCLIARVFRNKVKSEEKEIADEIKTSLRNFFPFTTSDKTYTIESLLLDASIASYITALIVSNSEKDFKTYDPNEDNLKEFTFEDSINSFFNPLAKLPNGTLYYIRSAYDLLFGESSLIPTTNG